MRPILSLYRRPPAACGSKHVERDVGRYQPEIDDGMKVQENSSRARPGSIVCVQPKALGRIRNTISDPAPSDVHAQSSAPAVVANIASGTGRPG